MKDIKRIGSPVLAVTTPPRSDPAAIRFDATRLGPGALLLTAGDDFDADTELVAWVEGIELGRVRLLGSLRVGETFSLPCGYFPHVALPCEVRIGTTDETFDVAAGLTLHSADEVELLVGPGRLEDVRLRVVNGYLEGSADNLSNGLGRPALLCRVNGRLYRAVEHVGARRRSAGGARLTFRVKLEATDFVETGIGYEIVQMPAHDVLAAIAFAPGILPELSRGVVRLEAGLEGLGRRLDLEVGKLREEAVRREREADATMEGVLEYVLALAHDTLMKPADQRGAAGAGIYRRIVERAGRLPEPTADRHIRPSSPYFIDGWHEVEIDPRGYDFRWMGLRASLLNPQPAMPVSSLTLTVSATAGEGPPQITATFDADPVRVRVVASANGTPYTVEIEPARPGPATAHVVYLGCGQIVPLEKHPEERRVLTQAVMGVTWRYRPDG